MSVLLEMISQVAVKAALKSPVAETLMVVRDAILEFWANPFVHLEWFIRLCIIVQSYIMVALAVVTLLLLARRNWVQRRMSTLGERWEMWLLDVMLEGKKSEKLLVPFVKKPSNLERMSLRETLVKHLRLLKGTERETLIQVYKANGFVTDDLVDSYSMFWPKRLKAVYNLGSLNRPLLAPEFRRLSQDPNELVSVAALLCLSQTDVSLDEARSWLANLPRCLEERRAVLFQLMRNFSQAHGPQVLWTCLLNTGEAWVKETALEVIVSMKTPEAYTTIEDLMKSRVGLSEAEKARLEQYLLQGAA
jgi:hypothetical protein